MSEPVGVMGMIVNIEEAHWGSAPLSLATVLLTTGLSEVVPIILPRGWLPDEAEVGDEVLISLKRLRKCSKCGCTNARACITGCKWVDLETCSNCGPLILGPEGEPTIVPRPSREADDALGAGAARRFREKYMVGRGDAG